MADEIGGSTWRHPTKQSLNDRRVDAVHNAMIKAGVPASKIQTGAFGDP
jgi:outer membrane protein OmpA-like peptidoglycan-associated protein